MIRLHYVILVMLMLAQCLARVGGQLTNKNPASGFTPPDGWAISVVQAVPLLGQLGERLHIVTSNRSL